MPLHPYHQGPPKCPVPGCTHPQMHGRLCRRHTAEWQEHHDWLMEKLADEERETL
jgi:hypothetical protein